MFEKITDLFMKFRFSKWWYLVIIVFVALCYRILVSAKKESKVKYERMQKILLLSIGIPLFIIIFLVICFFIYTGFSSSLVDNLSKVMVTALGILLLLIPLIYKLLQKRK